MEPPDVKRDPHPIWPDASALCIFRFMRKSGSWLVAALAVGCTPVPGADTPADEDPFGGMQCSAVRLQTEPDLMAWDSGSRANLKTLSRQGVVAVRYEANGCDVRLEILSNCVGEGEYKFEPNAANERKVARNASELFTELPLGAARLAGKVKQGKALRTDYMLVGMRTLPAGESYSRTQLRGAGCDRATHVVAKIYEGGFALVAGREREVESAASVFGAGGGVKVSGATERLASEGVAPACEEAQEQGKEDNRCAVPLRVGLLALDAISSVCPEGTELQGDKCVRKDVQVVTDVQCPPGTKKENNTCVPVVNKDCPSGMTWTAGRGCVANVVSPVATRQPATSPPAAGGGSCPSGMVSIPRGTFRMGSNSGDADEKPVHSVTLGAFCMDATEVTVDMYGACVRGGGCNTSDLNKWGTCNWGMGGMGNHPINCVDWKQASAYCRWANKRLPTEEEWEYAARGTDGRTYPWGNAAPSGQLCWKRSDGTCRVGSYSGGDSPFGLKDMAGNVWEWTSSGYSEDYSKNRANDTRVNRGGGWSDGDPSYVRAARRDWSDPTIRDIGLGFRCAR